ncbi:single-stranded DNA-binding protein [uncultured Bacteroides sp.]|uniref:single-stranded DNA-binding protein n=1 Tax=uncultured Bacteroides sp. TaxID=162156 RepID=UPI0025D947B2|nr:single-stranded DNA-binding protein [uncultured Bacteroides sp.]
MSVNKVILLGNVGQDPRVKYFDAGSAVATFPLATTERGYTLANGTQIPDRTEWHNIVASNRLAEIVDKYVHKGDKLYLEGKLRTRSYNDQTGATRYTTEIFVDNMEMLTPKGANPNAGAATSGQQTAATPAQQPQPGQQQTQQAQQPQQSQAQTVQDNPADDLPF